MNSLRGIQKPKNWNQILDSFSACDVPYAYIVAYYISRFDKKAYEKLALGNHTETHDAIGKILGIKANTIKNHRDAFDPYHDNPRKGWYQRELWRVEREVYEGFNVYSHEELYAIVRQILDTPQYSLELIFTLVSQDKDKYYLIDSQPYFPLTEEFVNECENKTFYEGAKQTITVNRYERNNQARQQCIEYYGTSCYICGFDFEQAFGELGKGFIHVHHLIPLSEINQEYQINSIKDLRPVCPNCHAIIHKKNPPFSIEEMKTILNKNFQHNDQ